MRLIGDSITVTSLVGLKLFKTNLRCCGEFIFVTGRKNSENEYDKKDESHVLWFNIQIY
jgi:hypothetical protein